MSNKIFANPGKIKNIVSINNFRVFAFLINLIILKILNVLKIVVIGPIEIELD